MQAGSPGAVPGDSTNLAVVAPRWSNRSVRDRARFDSVRRLRVDAAVRCPLPRATTARPPTNAGFVQGERLRFQRSKPGSIPGLRSRAGMARRSSIGLPVRRRGFDSRYLLHAPVAQKEGHRKTIANRRRDERGARTCFDRASAGDVRGQRCSRWGGFRVADAPGTASDEAMQGSAFPKRILYERCAGSSPAWGTAPTARCSGSNTVCKIVERGSTPRRASDASARGRDQRLLNAGLRDRHAPEAPRRIRLVAQDAGPSIRQRESMPSASRPRQRELRSRRLPR